MIHGKLTIQEINRQQAQLIMKHRVRILATGSDLPNHVIDLNWIRKYAKRFRDDLVRMGLAQEPK